MAVTILNVYYGALDGLQIMRMKDVKDVKEMARWNRNWVRDEVIVGSDHRTRRIAHQFIGGSPDCLDFYGQVFGSM